MIANKLEPFSEKSLKLNKIFFSTKHPSYKVPVKESYY